MRKFEVIFRLLCGSICCVSLAFADEGLVKHEDELKIRQVIERYANAYSSIDTETVLACISANSAMNGKYGVSESFYEKTRGNMEELERQLKSGNRGAAITDDFVICKIDVLEVKGDAVSASVYSKFTFHVGEHSIFDGEPFTWQVIRDDKHWKIYSYASTSLDDRQEQEDLLRSILSVLNMSLARKDAQQFADAIHLVTAGRLRDPESESTLSFMTRAGFGDLMPYFENQESRHEPAVRLAFNNDDSVTISLSISSQAEGDSPPAAELVKDIRIPLDRLKTVSREDVLNVQGE